MTTPRAALCVAMLLAVVAAGCGGDPDPSATTTEAPEATTTAPTTTTSSAPTSSTSPDTSTPETTMPPDDDGTGTGEEIFTEDDDGGTITGSVGEQALLQLSSEWAWEQPEVQGSAVILTPVDYMVDPGYMEWIVEMVGGGDAEIITSGTPNCADPASCPDRSVTFTVTVTD